MSTVRVRFAPSPTGELHVGGLRTALFNYLFAKHHNGTFVLRIEDTDRTRYVENAEQRLVDMLEWAGISPDEGPHKGGPYGPYQQSERLALYQAAAAQLIEQGHAYRCYCTPEELDEMRKAQVARNLPPKYDGRHRNLTEDDRRAYEAEGRVPVVRMRLPDRDERIVVDDLVRGKVVFNSGQLDDQVLIKSDGYPTYHLAVVVDDNAMGITHVLRAEEWLPSVPKHLYLYRWLGYELPQFVHLPLLLNPDRSKMSKRMGDVSVESYRDNGYLPAAMFNFLALLGWNPGNDQELFGRDALIQAFSIERVGKAGAVFDRDKLDWMNQQYIGQLSVEALYDAVQPFLAGTPYAAQDADFMKKILATVQPALIRLTDVVGHLAVFFRDDAAPLDGQVEQLLKDAAAKEVFGAFRDAAEAQEEWNRQAFVQLMKQVQKQTGQKGKAIWAPMRAAITLENEGPDLGEVVEVFGKTKTIARIQQAIAR